jgi:hypothetical protein
MSHPSIVFSKIGGVFYLQNAISTATPVGEMGETEGVLRWLIDHWPGTVYYFGPHKGTMPQGVQVLPWDARGLNEWSSGADICEQIVNPALEVLKHDPPMCFLCVAGYAVTMAWPDNPRGVMVQAASVRYTAPQLKLMHELKVPRLVINNDPRTYPREQEMIEMWPEAMPKALLSQRTRDWIRKVSRTPIDCREVYAAPENWCYRPTQDLNLERTLRCCVIAHAHIRDGVGKVARDDVWKRIFSPSRESRAHAEAGELEIYGKGWEKWTGYEAMKPAIKGVISPHEVDLKLASSICGPIVSIENGFYTGKIRTYLNQGCLPLLWGRGDDHTYDDQYRYVSQDDANLRLNAAGELWDRVRYWEKNEEERKQRIEQLLKLTQPDFMKLKQMLDRLHDGEDVNSEEWWQDFGGYRRPH